MAKSRVINTRFWDDNYTSNLDPIEKLLFLYLLTNTSTNISGIYEIPLKKIALETGIDKEMVSKILERFKVDKKVFYENGWMCLKNFVKNQNQNSPKVKTGINNELMAIPSDIMKIFIRYGYPIASNLIKSNLIKSKNTDSKQSESKKKSMKKNSFNYNESASSDSYEEAIDLDTGEKVESKKVNMTQKYNEMCKWAEDRRGFPFLSVPKQFKALAVARNAKISPERIKNRWGEMENDKFWKEKGFDFMDVVNSFNKKA